MDGLSAADVGLVSAAGAVVVFAVVYALLRGDRRDPLERVAAWARLRGLEYVAPGTASILATFSGRIGGLPVGVTVERVARGFGVDLPTKITTVAVGVPVDGSLTAPACLLQPAPWVLDRDGRALVKPVSSGDADFDAKWAARGIEADAARRLLNPEVRARLMEADAQGLIFELLPGKVIVPMPGLCSDAGELDRRVAVASGVFLALAPS